MIPQEPGTKGAELAGERMVQKKKITFFPHNDDLRLSYRQIKP